MKLQLRLFLMDWVRVGEGARQNAEQEKYPNDQKIIVLRVFCAVFRMDIRIKLS